MTNRLNACFCTAEIMIMAVLLYMLGRLLRTWTAVTSSTERYIMTMKTADVTDGGAYIIVGVIICEILLAAIVSVHISKMCSDRTCYMKRENVMNGQIHLMKQSMENLQSKYYMIEKEHKAKSRFLSRMSHDLRTPLNAIMGYSSLLEYSRMEPDKTGRYARRIFLSSQMLMELIDDALDMSCIETGKVKLAAREFSLSAAFDEVQNAVKPQIHAKELKFHLYITNSTDRDRVKGDKQKFCQVLRNLLSNAVKYTKPGGAVDLIVDIKDGEEVLNVQYQVKDTGCGMRQEFQDRIFGAFERENSEENLSTPGTGLGMCIAKSFVELMHGKIQVESELDVGTIVTVWIPMAAAGDPDEKSLYSLDNDEVLNGLNFLVAEDNESNAEIMQELMAASGAGCTIAVNGRDAVQLFEESDPGEFDMILMDVQMPVMNGYQAAREIRNSRHPDSGSIAIIAMTADAFEEDVNRAFMAGMNAHVAKPFNLKTFTDTVKSIKHPACCGVE